MVTKWAVTDREAAGHLQRVPHDSQLDRWASGRRSLIALGGHNWSKSTASQDVSISIEPGFFCRPAGSNNVICRRSRERVFLQMVGVMTMRTPVLKMIPPDPQAPSAKIVFCNLGPGHRSNPSSRSCYV